MNKIILNKLCESGLSRIEQWMQMHDIACISACRSKIKDITKGTNVEDVERWNIEGDYVLTPQENKQRTTQLKAKLLALGYGVTAIDGSYIEGFGKNGVEVSENSFFVVNLKDNEIFFDNIIELSEYFNQDSILIKPKGELAYLYGTNNADFPGYRQKTEGKNYHALSGRFMSRVKKAAFSFANSNNLVMRNSKEDMSKKDNEDYEHEILFRKDTRPNFRDNKQKRIEQNEKIKNENISLSEICINKLNEHIDKIILNVRENYKGFQKQNLMSTANLVTEGLKRTKS